MYEGMSYVQLYKNRGCTEVIPQDVNGNYTLDFGVISNNAHSPLTFNIYAKNIGTHKAYDVTITQLSGNATITFIKCDVIQNQIKFIPLSLIINKNQTTQESIVFKVEYDSI